MAQIRGNWFPCLRSALDRHAHLAAIDELLPMTTHNILWSNDPQKWFDEGHAVAIYEELARSVDLDPCRLVGRDAARFAMVGPWHQWMQPLVGLLGATPRLAFEQLPILWNATRQDAGELVCVESSLRHAVTEVRGFPYATSQAWVQVWLGHHDALLRQLRFAGRVDLQDHDDEQITRVRVTWGTALQSKPTTFGEK